MIRTFAMVAIVAAMVTPASAQAPGWIPTGEWQCGPNVRVIVSIDGFGAMDFFVKGAWFDNHYTVRRGQLFYNSVPCASVGNVWPPQPPPRKRQSTRPSGEQCTDATCPQDMID
jgi:hypothetical protein